MAAPFRHTSRYHPHFFIISCYRRDASHNPLTFEEKKTLIAQIHKLPADKMPHVLNIIQSALPPRENDEDGDIEVPLDALDTFTLRKLQKFIEVSVVFGGDTSSVGGLINGSAGFIFIQQLDVHRSVR